MSSYGTWLSAAGMQAAEHRQNVISNNLANAHTVGFKHDYVVIAQRAIESRVSPDGWLLSHPVYDGMTGGLQANQSHIDFGQGAVEETGRPLDVAIDGDGFFAVQREDDVRYTRDGTFTLNANRELVLATHDGSWRVLDKTSRPIVLAGQGAVRVSPDGTIYQGENAVADLAVVTTDDKQQLRKQGENLFSLERGEMVESDAMIVAEAVEHSTYDPILGLTGMIEASRAYQMNATVLQMQDHATEQAVTVLGRVG